MSPSTTNESSKTELINYVEYLLTNSEQEIQKHLRASKYYEGWNSYSINFTSILSFSTAFTSGSIVSSMFLFPPWLNFVLSTSLWAWTEYSKKEDYATRSSIHLHLSLLYSELQDFLNFQLLLNLKGEHKVYIENGEAKAATSWEDYEGYVYEQIENRLKIIRSSYIAPPEA